MSSTSKVRYLGNRPITIKAKKNSTESSIDAIFDDTFPTESDGQIDHSTPKSSSRVSKRTLNSFSLLSSQEKLQLSSWGLPETVLNQYYDSGI